MIDYLKDIFSNWMFSSGINFMCAINAIVFAILVHPVFTLLAIAHMLASYFAYRMWKGNNND